MFSLYDRDSGTIYFIHPQTARAVLTPAGDEGDDCAFEVLLYQSDVDYEVIYHAPQPECEAFLDAFFAALCTGKGATVQQLSARKTTRRKPVAHVGKVLRMVSA